MGKNLKSRLNPKRYKGTYKRSEVKMADGVLRETSPRIVYRIEHPESGKGPFTHEQHCGMFASDAMVYLAEPSDFNVPELRHGSTYRYAFKDPWVMMSAIQSLMRLRELGFHFAIYESNEHIVLPDGQVAFINDKAIRQKSYPIHEFPFDNF